MINTNILLALNILAVIWLSILSFVYWSSLKDKKKIVKQIKNKGVDNFLQEIMEKNNQIERDIYKLYKASKEINNIATKSISKKAVIRYNPFGDTGGDQSFSIALLDLQDNGIVVTSLHSRTSTRIYAKPVVSGRSSHYLTEEEKEVIKNSQNISQDGSKQ